MDHGKVLNRPFSPPAFKTKAYRDNSELIATPSTVFTRLSLFFPPNNHQNWHVSLSIPVVPFINVTANLTQTEKYKKMPYE